VLAYVVGQSILRTEDDEPSAPIRSVPVAEVLSEKVAVIVDASDVDIEVIFFDH
jgi:hypothetical protein